MVEKKRLFPQPQDGSIPSLRMAQGSGKLNREEALLKGRQTPGKERLQPLVLEGSPRLDGNCPQSSEALSHLRIVSCKPYHGHRKILHGKDASLTLNYPTTSRKSPSVGTVCLKQVNCFRFNSMVGPVEKPSPDPRAGRSSSGSSATFWTCLPKGTRKRLSGSVPYTSSRPGVPIEW